MAHQSLNIDTLVKVLNEVGAYIFTKDLEGRYTYANSLVLELFDVTLDELIGKDDYCFFEEEQIQGLIENDKKVFNGEIIETEEILIVKRTGEERHYITVKKPLYDESKNVIGMCGISTDITEQKVLEKRISDQKHFLDIILDNVDAVIFMKDENRVFRYANSNLAKLFKLPVDEIIGKKDTDIIPKEIADKFWETDLKVLNTKEKISIEEYFENDHGHSFYWSVKIPYTLEDNTPVVLGLATDITELKIKDKEIQVKDKILYQQAKISTMGEMIENIAHQWRQPLSVISTTATGTKLKKEINSLSTQELYENMDSINNHAQYLSATIDDFRNFFLSDSYEKIEVNLKDSIKKAITLIKDSYASSNINLITSLEENFTFTCKENLFIQALINILNNARDALNQIEDPKFEKLVFVELIQKDDEYIIVIKDNAKGIKEENIDKVFEPYFTTKHSSQGTGIGLYMTYQIITKHLETSIIATNEEYEYLGENFKGAAFTISIPKE